MIPDTQPSVHRVTKTHAVKRFNDRFPSNDEILIANFATQSFGAKAFDNLRNCQVHYERRQGTSGITMNKTTARCLAHGTESPLKMILIGSFARICIMCLNGK